MLRESLMSILNASDWNTVFFVSVVNYHHEHLVVFSCKRRGFCPSCGARRLAETAALLVDDVLPHKPIRQWVLSFPYLLRFLLASNPLVVTKVLASPCMRVWQQKRVNVRN
ncbi:MAG: hypothetical protein ACJAYN_003207 [Bermanella sp.]|jgi:hypothetical protein